MSTTITCPNCSTQFEPTDAIAASIEKEMRNKLEAEWKRRLEVMNAEKQQLEAVKKDLEQQKAAHDELLRKEVEAAKADMKNSLTQQLQQELQATYATELNYLKETQAKNEERLKAANQMELELLQLKDRYEQQQQEQELKLQKVLMEEKEKMQERLRNDEEARSKLKDQEYQLKLKDLEKQLDDQRKLAEEMKRKAEQGSMQTQGEVLELAIEEWLKGSFPLDTIEEIKKGARGADCIQIVNTRGAQHCGSIYYESKRTKDFQPSWMEKFKTDIREKGASIGVLVTEALPKDMERMGQREGIWICTFEEFKGLSHVLREMLIHIHDAVSSQENKGDKMSLVYEYVTGNEFRMQVEAIVEGFSQMKMDLEQEKRAMESIWKKRQKQIDKVLLNTNYIYSSIKGIAGNAIGNIAQLELPTGEAGHEDAYVIEE